jgi:hypothetical protein
MKKIWRDHWTTSGQTDSRKQINGKRLLGFRHMEHAISAGTVDRPTRNALKAAWLNTKLWTSGTTFSILRQLPDCWEINTKLPKRTACSTGSELKQWISGLTYFKWCLMWSTRTSKIRRWARKEEDHIEGIWRFHCLLYQHWYELKEPKGWTSWVFDNNRSVLDGTRRMCMTKWESYIWEP